MHQAQRTIKGTEWEKVLFPEAKTMKDARALESFHVGEDARLACILETLEMIESGNIPVDEMHGTIMRIKEIKAELKRQPLEEKMVHLRIIQELHERIFEFRKRARNEASA